MSLKSQRTISSIEVITHKKFKVIIENMSKISENCSFVILDKAIVAEYETMK